MSEAAETGIGLWIRRHLNPGGVMIDVGANTGSFTDLGARIVGPTGRIVAFEPGPDNGAALRERFGHLSQVTIVEAAVAERRGSANFFLDGQNRMQHSLSTSNVGRSGQTIQVSTVTLDDYIPEFRRVDVVKIDAQGAELQILQGARGLLRAFRPNVTVEFWPVGLRNMGTDPMQLVEELKTAGYDMYRLSAKGRLKPEHRIAEFMARAGRWSSINLAAHPRVS